MISCFGRSQNVTSLKTLIRRSAGLRIHLCNKTFQHAKILKVCEGAFPMWTRDLKSLTQEPQLSN